MKRAICFLLVFLMIFVLATNIFMCQDKTPVKPYGSYNLIEENMKMKAWRDWEISYEEWYEIWETKLTSSEWEMWLEYLKGKEYEPRLKWSNAFPRTHFLPWEVEYDIPKRIWETRYVAVDRASVYSLDGESILGTVKYTDRLKSTRYADGYMVELEGHKGWVSQEVLLSANVLLERDQYLLAQIGMAEAGGVGKSEMLLVMEVVTNRVATSYRDFAHVSTLIEVLMQKNQYPDTVKKIRNKLIPSTEALECAELILVGDYDRVLPEDCFWQTGFKPGWAAKVIYKSPCGNGYTHYYSVPSS